MLVLYNEILVIFFKKKKKKKIFVFNVLNTIRVEFRPPYVYGIVFQKSL